MNCPVKSPQGKTVAVIAALVCMLGVVAVFVFRSFVFSSCQPSASVESSATASVAEPPRDRRAPVLEGSEVKREALILREGLRYRQGETAPFTGVMTEFYGDGTLQSRSVISNGLLEGLSEGWYTNGCKQVEEIFRGGVSHGLRVKWYENGQDLSEAPIVSGKMEGVFKRWHENGVLAEEVPMRNGNPNGLVRAFYPSGRLKAEARLTDGVVSDQKNWADGESPVCAPDSDKRRK